jgi:type III secretion system low calcium response chaperone LcrH/SycD
MTENMQELIETAIDELDADMSPVLKKRQHELLSKMTLEGQTARQAMGIDDNAMEYMYGEARSLYNNGLYEKARSVFEVLAMIDPKHPFVMGIASCLHMQKKYKEAVYTYIQASFIDNDSPLPFYYMADCFEQLGKETLKAVSLKMLLRRAGNDPAYAMIAERATRMLEGSLQKLKEE